MTASSWPVHDPSQARELLAEKAGSVLKAGLDLVTTSRSTSSSRRGSWT